MKIALSQRVLYYKNRAYDSIEHVWYEFLHQHELMLVANRLPVNISGIDALIITGGDDHPVRNQVELELVNNMLSRDLPVIGVCHGCQLLTQRLGGSVVPVDDHQDCWHEVFYQEQPYLVNSYHKLRIKHAPPGATVLAHDPDGHAEAWIRDNVAAVMWHPERMTQPWWPDEVKRLLTA